jgi:neurofibromin 1
MAPWLPNLSIFARNSPEDGKQTLTKTKEVIRLLIDLTVTRNDVSATIEVTARIIPVETNDFLFS